MIRSSPPYGCAGPSCSRQRAGDALAQYLREREAKAGRSSLQLPAGETIARAHVSSDENKTLVRRYYEEVVNTGAIEEVGRFISPDYVEVHDNKRYSIGLEGVKEHIRGVRQTYPDLNLTVEQQIAEGEWVVTRVTMRGTHRGEWQGIKPTGRPVEVTAVNLDRVVGGRIVEHGGAANLLGPFLEIGGVVRSGNG